MKRPKTNILLEANISKKGDTNKSLAGYLGKNESTVANKRNGDRDWTCGEMIALSKRYDMNEEQFINTFFPGMFA